jgi:hypothetical protein
MNILLILLGCNIYSILLNRLETSFKFIEENINTDDNIGVNINSTTTTFTTMNPFEQNKITWFLSGGIKNNFLGAKSEASIMKSQISNIIDSKYNLDTQENKKNDAKFRWYFVLDEKSTNTAENFIWASQFLNTTDESYDAIYVITSAFHYKRAQTMFNLIDPSKNLKWILGDLEEKDSRYWESVHINNVHSDISKAKSKLENSLF